MHNFLSEGLNFGPASSGTCWRNSSSNPESLRKTLGKTELGANVRLTGSLPALPERSPPTPKTSLPAFSDSPAADDDSVGKLVAHAGSRPEMPDDIRCGNARTRARAGARRREWQRMGEDRSALLNFAKQTRRKFKHCTVFRMFFCCKISKGKLNFSFALPAIPTLRPLRLRSCQLRRKFSPGGKDGGRSRKEFNF